MSTLSPLLISSLRESMALAALYARPAAADRRGAVRRQVTVYECPVCSEWHVDEDDAKECCAAANDDSAREPTALAPSHCPVCRQRAEADSTYAAAECCLWKSVGHWDRYRIAQAVEAGAGWIDAIEAITGDKVPAP